ncbi:MAG: hypothetical protein ACSW8J_06265, partial [bacterium]
MKRSYNLLLLLTITAAVCGAVLSLTLDAGTGLRETLSRALILAALAGFAGTAALRPQAQRAGNGSIGGAVSAKERSNCTFRNVAANDQALQSLTELRDYLQSPEKYVKYGARMPKGVLLYG